MFMISFRMRRAGIIFAAVLLLVMATLGVMGARSIWDGATVSTGLFGNAAAKKNTVKTNEQRLDFVKSFGWEVVEEPVEVMEVIIPKEFDSVYEGYNSMQKKQGFDLTKHAGKRCKRYSYEVTNYPGQESDVRFHLIVRDNKVIGGDISSLLAGGFMHGFNAPETQTES